MNVVLCLPKRCVKQFFESSASSGRGGIPGCPGPSKPVSIPPARSWEVALVQTNRRIRLEAGALKPRSHLRSPTIVAHLISRDFLVRYTRRWKPTAGGRHHACSRPAGGAGGGPG